MIAVQTTMRRMSSLLRHLFGSSAPRRSVRPPAVSGARPRHAGASTASSDNPSFDSVDQENLAAMVSQHGPLPIDVAIDCVLQTADIVSALHDRGEPHPPLTAESLYVDDDGGLNLSTSGDHAHTDRPGHGTAGDIHELASLLEFLLSGERSPGESLLQAQSAVEIALMQIVLSAKRGRFGQVDDFMTAICTLQQDDSIAMAG